MLQVSTQFNCAMQTCTTPKSTPVPSPGLLSEDLTRGGVSMAGASVIRKPSWLRLPAGVPVGRYLLYFSHHDGKALRLAASDWLDRGWRLHRSGVLQVQRDTKCTKHVGSPDVHIDHLNRRLVMYFHGCRCPGDGDKPEAVRRGDQIVPWDEFVANQRTYVAWSSDGVRFESVPSRRQSQSLSPWRTNRYLDSIPAQHQVCCAP